MITVESLSDPHAGLWDAYVAGAPKATAYHAYGWRTALTRAYDLRTHYLAAMEDGQVRGILPLAALELGRGRRQLISLPFANFGGVVADSADVEARLVAAARELLVRERMELLELKQLVRCDAPGLADKPGYDHLYLPLSSDPDAVWNARLGKTARKKVRRAQETALQVTTGPDGFAAFIDIYRRSLRDLGSPAHARRWYQALHDLLGDRSELYVARLAGRVVAGLWVFFHRDVAYAHAAAARRAHLDLNPNYLVHWAAIAAACRRGCRRFDFCRSRVGSGTHFFKQLWGVETEPMHDQYVLHTAKHIPDVDPHNPRYALAIAVWKRLPVAVANALGPRLRQRIGT